MSKNPGKLGFVQPNKGTGKTSSAKNKTNVPFKQPAHGTTGNSTAKNPAKASFKQPTHGGSAKMPAASGPGSVGAKATKMKGSPSVGPKMKSIDDLMAYRKKTYGV